jgi:hypothetical protein
MNTWQKLLWLLNDMKYSIAIVAALLATLVLTIF